MEEDGSSKIAKKKLRSEDHCNDWKSSTILDRTTHSKHWADRDDHFMDYTADRMWDDEDARPERSKII